MLIVDSVQQYSTLLQNAGLLYRYVNYIWQKYNVRICQRKNWIIGYNSERNVYIGMIQEQIHIDLTRRHFKKRYITAQRKNVYVCQMINRVSASDIKLLWLGNNLK